ncbi:MAG: pyridoxamine 5'-phosphate oxidase [Candidatus Lustribacter sp.]|jgi:pyridoxamine 5'-phosphate oxidase
MLERRHSYDRATLDEASAAAEPFAQFGRWIADAVAADLLEPNAMTVATVDAGGRPSARIVLLRGWNERGFVFFTNYESQKGREIAANPAAALLFFWAQLQRQVRIDGRVELLAAADSDAYFARRPRGHRISAWASPQSEVIADRAALEARMEEMERRFDGADVPRPPHWGGYRVVPERFEFWQGRPDRAHDRLAYTLAPAGWVRTRLAP